MEVSPLSGERKRELGVDLLRMASMYLVLILHILGNGGILTAAPWMSWRYAAAWLLETGAMCAVNCFALISGYVGVNSTFRASRLLNLWLQTVFYAVGLNALFAILRPGSVSAGALLKSFLPMTTGMYWYVTAYFGLSLFIPLLNQALRHTPRRFLKFLLLSMLTILAFLPCILQQSTYGLGSGYSMAWLGILYLLGGHAKLMDLPRRVTKKRAAALFLLSTLAAWGSKLALEAATTRWLGEARWSDTFLSYLSPFIVLDALALLCLFAHLDIRAAWAVKLVGALSPAALGVYLIHVHPMFWAYILAGMAVPLLDFPAPVMALGVLGLALALYVGCSLVELLRLRLFKLLRVDTICRRLDGVLSAWLGDDIT